MRYTPYRGLTQVTNWVRLKFTAMNLKKFAVHRWNMSNPTAFSDCICIFFINLKKFTLNPNGFRVFLQAEKQEKLASFFGTEGEILLLLSKPPPELSPEFSQQASCT